ncbi:MAG: hypothetical protein GY737_09350 [Desulfobacteraceae bacterium]|nr:hypothetical protein [Desulfobacteraceae bacterium]
MNLMKSNLSYLIVFLILISLSGCSAEKNGPALFSIYDSSPQVIVEPASISLGVAALLDTKVVFKGRGFRPRDSVNIKLLPLKDDITEAESSIPIATGYTDKEGNFSAKIEKLVKISELLKADVTLNDNMEPIVILDAPPINEGVYIVLVESLNYGSMAEDQLTFKAPDFMDRLKDRIGEARGLIVRR